MKVFNKSRNNILIGDVKVATSFDSRVVGLMFSHSAGGGLLIKPCNSIHTFFMRYPLDVAFLDKQYRVVKLIRNLRPWRITPIYLRARMVLEMEAGDMANIELGDILCLN